MGSRRLDSLSDLVRHNLALKVECSCGRVVIMNAAKLLEQCRERGVPRSLLAVAHHLKCERCGRRPRKCEAM